MDYLTARGARFATHALNPCAATFREADAPPREAWTDAWRAAHGDWPLGNTFPAAPGGSSVDPSRPDRILVRGPMPVCATELAAAPPGLPPWSDHRAVVAELAL